MTIATQACKTVAGMEAVAIVVPIDVLPPTCVVEHKGNCVQPFSEKVSPMFQMLGTVVVGRRSFVKCHVLLR